MTADAGKERCEIDGRYFTIGPQLQPLFRKLQRGCTEAEVRQEVDLLRRGRHDEVAEPGAFLNRVFAPFGLVIDQQPAGGRVLWRLRASAAGIGRLTPESAIRCRITVLPETAASRVALATKGLYSGMGAGAAALFLLAACGLYVGRFGEGGFSLDLLFAFLQQISAWSAVTMAVCVIASALCHEIGHCAAVAAFGARVRRVGFGIYWVSPAFFSDVSSAWTLGRWQRVVVDCGGIYFQLLACGLYAALAATAHSQDMRAALQVAIVVNAVSMVCSLNPMMKYDGYWMISDALDIPNLRRRSEGALREAIRMRFRGPQPKRALLLIAYALLSVVFTVVFLVVLALAIGHHIAEAAQFPERVWTVLRRDIELRHFGPEVSDLGIAFLRLMPVACAPVALLTAVSGVLGFLRRMAAEG